MNKRFSNNNFDFLRFLFALLVVVSHSYALSGASESNTGISFLTKGQLSFSQIGLSGFFVISGFFIFRSLQRSNCLYEYFKKRFLRLFPALFVVLLVSLLLVPIVYINTIPFLQNKEVFTYLPYNLSLYGFQSGIKGVFDANSYHSINGSLWTIRYEFTLYVVLSILFFIKSKKIIIVALLSVSFFAFYILYIFFLPKLAGVSLLNLLGGHVLNLGTFFIAGSLLASIELDTIRNKKSWLILSLVILLSSLYFNCYDLIKHIVFSFFILLLGFNSIKWIKDFGRLGDTSYGIYIYSFPIQQTLIYFFKMNSYLLMIYSVPLSIIFGFLSWHLIEKKTLRYK